MRHKIERDLVEASVSAFIEQRRRGKIPSVEDYVNQAPEAADSLRELLPLVCQLELIRDRRNQHSGSHLAQCVRKLERLGDFRIIRELGRGGMGVVFEAEQESLGRRVAIKVLPKLALLDDQRIERFRREAQTAARLHHTHIVPIFGVGQHADYHYYVMQLIQGVGLDAVLRQLRRITGDDGYLNQPHYSKERVANTMAASSLARAMLEGDLFAANPLPGSPAGRKFGGANDEAKSLDGAVLRADQHTDSKDTPVSEAGKSMLPLPKYYRTIAQIALQAADALQYAHAQGTLHRDIKPGNLLLDMQGTVWIADFGLAKSLGQHELSRSDDAVGTLRYMAPERFRGIVDDGADIYSLGLTLYELLTLRPAYADQDPGALVRQINEGGLLRPRRINPRIPRDLETIALTATAHHPSQRYATAAAMAEDLQLFLEDRPINARRATVIERLWRWCRRNAALAVLTATVAILLVAVTAVSVVSNWQTTRAYRQAQTALTSAATERERAEGISEVALLALDRISASLTPEQIDSTRMVIKDLQGNRSVSFVYSEHTAALLKEMHNHYQRMSERMGDSALLQDRKAEMARRLGFVRYTIGQFDRASISYNEAIRLYRSLIRNYPERCEAYIGAAECLNEQGDVLWTTCQPREAYRYYKEALAILESAPHVDRESPKLRFAFATSYYHLRPRRYTAGLPDWLVPSGVSVEAGAQPWGAGDTLASAVKTLRELLVEFPDDRSFRRLLALCLREQASFVAAPAKDPRNDEAIAILSSLTQEEPLIPDYRYDLARAYSNVGDCSAWQNEVDFLQAAERLKLAETFLDPITRENPNIYKYVFEMAGIYHRQAIAVDYATRELSVQRPGLKSNLMRAEATIGSLTRRRPEVAAFWLWSAIVNKRLADIAAERKEWDEANACLEKAIAALHNIEDDHPTEILFDAQTLLTQVRHDLADAIRRQTAH